MIAGILLGGVFGPSIGAAWRVRALGWRCVTGGMLVAGTGLWAWWTLVGGIAQVVPPGPAWFMGFLQVFAFVGGGMAPGVITAIVLRALRRRRRDATRGEYDSGRLGP